MSLETINWLNTQTLIGFTDKRGHAWHYRAIEQGEQSNHYPGPVPVEDVRARLMNWTAMSRPVRKSLPADIETATDMDEDGLPVRWVPMPDRQVICRSDTGADLGVFKIDYSIHQHQDWLLDEVAQILDGDLSIGSAGLLKGGAVAWVSVEVPDTIVTPEGVAFRPNLLACTSHDGSLSTTYQRVVTNVVCDNTMSAALSEDGPRLKVRHSKHSKRRLIDVRQALELVHTIADGFTAQVAKLCAQDVNDRQWAAFLDAVAKVDANATRRSQTMATNKRESLKRLYAHDERVAPWAGTAWGVVQAMNTYTHHEGIVRGVRADRNMLRAVNGEVDKLDADTLKVLAQVA